MRHSNLEDDVTFSIEDVYAVSGDYGNVGGGSLIGIFIIEEEAKKAAIGRGSRDCGGDGMVTKRKAIKVNQTYYLLDSYVQFGIKEGIVTNRGKYDFEALKG